MSLETLILLLLIGLSVVLFVGEPLVRSEQATASSHPTDGKWEQLTLHKETLYMAIRDLEFDFRTGKVDQSDYLHLRQQLESEAVQVLRHLDEIDPAAILDRDLERQILALRQPAAMPSRATSEICLGCRTPLSGKENFCPSCGQPQLTS